MSSCILCSKIFSSETKLINHYTKKSPCIDNTILWHTNKHKYITNITFNQYQLEFIESPLEDSKLLGIPGGGKTRCIIEKIFKHLSNNDYLSNNDFIILSFSKRARFDFIEKGKIYKKIFTKNNVRTLHSLAQLIVSTLQKNNTNSLETIILAALNLIKNKSLESIKQLPIFSSIKTIYLDESQDISESQYQLVSQIKNKLKCHLIMVGDPNQNIYQFQGGSDKFLLEYPGKTYYLKHNYRSSQNIVALTNSISPNKLNIMESASQSEENNKITISVNSIEDIKTQIIAEINSYCGDLSQIAIIGPVRKSNPISNTYLNIGLSYIVNILEEHNIQYTKFFKDSNSYNTQQDTEVRRSNNHVNLLTIHGSKGLEFDKVILLNFHFNTFGIQPSLEDYNRFRYLWYVAVSRAKTDLSIYCLNNRIIWPLIKHIPSDIYTINKPPVFPKLTFNETRKKLNHGVTELLKNAKPEQLYTLENLINHKVIEHQIYQVDNTKILEYREYSTLYGLFIEKIFEYYYSLKNNNITNNIFYKFKQHIEIGIFIDAKLARYVIMLIKRLNYKLTDQFYLEIFHNHKHKFSSKELQVYHYIESKISNRLQPFTLIFENEVIINDLDYIIELCNSMITNYNHPKYIQHIFQIILYNYQIDNEAAYLWKKDFTPHLNTLQPFIDKIQEYVANIKDTMEFGIQTQHPNLPIIGIIDILQNKNTIIDIKFTKNLDIKHILQVLFYYNNLFPSWNKPKSLFVLNLQKGINYQIIIDPRINNYDILKQLCLITKEKMTNLLFLYDLETTGLDTQTCEIIERYFLEYNLNFVISEGIININKTIPPFITDLTGISNKMIFNGDDTKKIYSDIEELYKYSTNPKFMAHNGNSFDHKILTHQKILPKNYDNLLDSRYIIRMLADSDNNDLKYLFDTIVKTKIENYHRAKVDVIMLQQIMKKLDFKI